MIDRSRRLGAIVLVIEIAQAIELAGQDFHTAADVVKGREHLLAGGCQPWERAVAGDGTRPIRMRASKRPERKRQGRVAGVVCGMRLGAPLDLAAVIAASHGLFQKPALPPMAAMFIRIGSIPRPGNRM